MALLLEPHDRDRTLALAAEPNRAAGDRAAVAAPRPRPAEPGAAVIATRAPPSAPAAPAAFAPGTPAAPPAPPEAPATTAAVRPRRRLLRAALLAGAVLVVAAMAGAGYAYWTVLRFEISTDDAVVEADVVTIAPQVAGRIASVRVDDNASVHAGDVLATIDDRPFVAALDLAKADVAAAAANVADLAAELKAQASVIAQAEASVAMDEAEQRYAAANQVRFGTLADHGYGSVRDAEEAASQNASLGAAITKDQAAVEAAKQQVAVLEAKLDEAKGILARTEAAADTAAINLGYTTIVAPTDGVVGARTVRVGQIVEPGTALLAVVPLSRTYVVANFKETDLTDVRPGQPVQISVDTFPDATVRGTVDSIAPASGGEFALLPPDNATGNFTKVVQRIPVKITLDPGTAPAVVLRPGMSVIPTIDTRAEAR